EGGLWHCTFPDECLLSHDETSLLKRATIAPLQDFVVLHLEQQSVAPIFKQVMAAGLSVAIIHVQIERNEVLELGAYDNFHPKCVVTGPGVSPELLAELKSSNVIRGFKVSAT